MSTKIIITLDKEDLERLDRYRAEDDYRFDRQEAVRRIVLWELEGMDGLDPVPSEFEVKSRRD